MARRKQKKEINITLLVISLIIILAIYIFNRLNFIRPILWFVALIFISIFIKKYSKLTAMETLYALFILFFVSIVLDGIIVTVFKRIPAYTYNVVSSDKVNIYYSPGLRVWQCNKESYKDLLVDQFYNNGYMCSANDISTIESNSFLNSVIENFDEYHNKYVKVYGKISKKNSQKSIEMRPYIESEVKVNGYVEFSNSVVLKIFFEKNENILDEYDVYDDITVLGLVKNMEGSSGNYIVYMDEAKILGTADLNDFSISVTTEKKCSNKKLLISNEKTDVYSYCLSEIFVSANGTTNELVDMFSSNKITEKDLYKDSEKVEKDDNGNRIYRMNNYSVLVCNSSYSKDIIIGRDKLKFNDVECTKRVEEQ